MCSSVAITVVNGALLYGLSGTCCLNGIDPQAYLRHWICPYISRHLLSLNPLLARCRRYSRGER